MKRLFISLIIFLYIPITIIAEESQSKNNSLQPADVQQRFDDVKHTAQALFNPVFVSTGTPKSNPYPTTSINEKAVDALYGKEGLQVDPELVRYIKNFYFYLEYITKLQVAAHIAGYARQKNIDVTSVLEAKSWKGLIDKASSVAGGLQQLIVAISKAAPDWDDVKGSIVAASWSDLIKTSFWQTIDITPEMIIASPFWQEYIQYSVLDTFRQDNALLKSIVDIEKTIFRFIPNIEVAYYHPDFIQIRNSGEFARLHLIVTEQVRARFIRQSIAWEPFVDKKSGQIDLVKTYSAAMEVEATGLYQLISLAQTTSLGTLAQQALNKKLPIDVALLKKPLLQEKMLCIAMLKNLQAQTYYLFDDAHIKQTMSVLGKNNTQPAPHLLLYQSEDAIYLEDLAALLKNFKEAAAQAATSSDTTTSAGKGNAKVVVQDFGSWLSGSWNDIKKTGQDILQGIQDVGKTALDEAEAIGAAGAAGIIGAIDPHKGQELIDLSKKLQDEVAADINRSITDAQNVIDDTAAVAKDFTKGAASIVGEIFAKISRDPKLGSDIEGVIESLTDVVINFYANQGHIAVSAGGGLIRLGTDAVNLASTVISDSIIGAKTGDWQAFGQDIVNSLNSLAYDVVTSLLNVATFIVQNFVDALKALIKCAAYLVSMITDILIDVSKGIFNALAGIFDIFGWQAGANAVQDASQWIANHRRLIESHVTTGLLIGAVIATDGAALPLLAMTVGPQIFQEYGSYQNDERAAEKLAKEKKFVADYQVFVNNNKIISENAKNAWADELTKKYDAQVINQKRNIGFYQNFLSDYVLNTEEQLSYYLGQYLLPQITPDSTGLIPADVGSLYGFKTGVLNLNPSQGFPLYNKGRNAFSQEIAVYPSLAFGQEDNKQVSSKAPRKFWFNQKETIVLDNAVSEVEVRWQALYVLNEFYIGLYFGGIPVDVEAIKKTGKANINSAHLAKMVVYKKEEKDSPVMLNFYEHEGLGWLNPPLKGPQFDVGTWYRMNMQLQGTKLIVRVWKEGDEKPGGQEIAVSETSGKTIGIISAGASIEYDVVTPALAIKEVPAVRKSLGLLDEQEREIAARTNLAALTNPSLGTIPLQAVSIVQILKGQYIYTTQKTGLHGANGQPMDDYVVLGTSSIDRVTNQYTIQHIGSSPTTSPNAMISLITSRAFDQNGSYLTTCENVLDVYIKQYGPLTDDLEKKLDMLQKNYMSTLMGPFAFGAIEIQPTSSDEIKNGQFIYKAISLAPELHDKQNKPVKDAKGNTLYDYFVVVTTDARNNELIGAPYDATVSRIRSLVTGNEYDKKSTEPVEKGHRASDSLRIYQQSFGQLPPTLAQAIDNSTTFYVSVTQEAQNAPSSTPLAAPTQKTTTADTGEKSNHSSTVLTTTPTTLVPVGQQQSIQKRTEEAGASQESWGG